MKVSVEDINALLPQTQCEQCTYPGCKPYAEAIVHEQAETHLCQPGGQEVYQKIQSMLELPIEQNALDIITNYPNHHRLTINNDHCIGCTKCIPACPVDAIIGGPKAMHHIIADLCTGCDLCLPACPVDCISAEDIDELPAPAILKAQYEQHQKRLLNEQANQNQSIDHAVKQIAHASSDVLKAALLRAKEKKQQK